MTCLCISKSNELSSLTKIMSKIKKYKGNFPQYVIEKGNLTDEEIDSLLVAHLTCDCCGAVDNHFKYCCCA
jgi:predicted metal-dependent RNase